MDSHSDDVFKEHYSFTWKTDIMELTKARDIHFGSFNLVLELQPQICRSVVHVFLYDKGQSNATFDIKTCVLNNEEKKEFEQPYKGSLKNGPAIWSMKWRELLESENILSASGKLTFGFEISAIIEIEKCTPSTSSGFPSFTAKASTKLEGMQQTSLEKMSFDFGKLLENKEGSNVTFMCVDRQFKAHRCILSARSDVFAAMFKSGMLESKNGVVTIDNMDPETLERMLRYIYSANIEELTVETASKLYKAVNQYGIEPLKNSCASYLTETLSQISACDVLLLADTYSDEQLKISVVDFMVENCAFLCTDKWNKFCEEHPFLGNKVYEQYAYKQAQCRTSEEKCKSPVYPASNVLKQLLNTIATLPTPGPRERPAQSTSGVGGLPRQPTPGSTELPAQSTSGVGGLPAQSTSGIGGLPAQLTSGLRKLPAQSTSGVGGLPAQSTSGVGGLPAQSTSGIGGLPAQLTSGLRKLPAQSTSGVGGLPSQPTSGYRKLPAQYASEVGRLQPQPAVGFKAQRTSRLGGQPLQPTSGFLEQQVESARGIKRQLVQPMSVTKRAATVAPGAAHETLNSTDDIIEAASIKAAEENPPSLEKLSRDFINLFDSELESDVVLECADRQIRAHRCILSTRSDVFAAMLVSTAMQNDAEGENGVVTITDVAPETLERMLRYIYSGKVEELTMETASELYKAADEYEILSLKRLCASILSENLSQISACDVLLLADTCSDEQLEKSAVEFMVNNSEVFGTDQWHKFCKEHPSFGNKVYRKYVFKHSQSNSGLIFKK